MRILIVEDSVVIAKRLEAMVSELGKGIDVIGHAADVPGAIEAVRQMHPDLVILDIRMPGGTGIDVLKFIKQEYPHTTVMMLSNYPEAAYRQKCSAAGAEYFFDKSTEFELVRETLRQLHRESQVTILPVASKEIEKEELK